MKEEIGKQDFIKIKNVCSEKKQCQVNEKTNHRLEKNFAKPISDKGLEYTKNSLNSLIRKQPN